MKKQSSFTGSAWGLFGWYLLIGLSAYLLFIPLAFIMPKYMQWYYENTKVDGKQLEFKYEGPWWGAIGWMLFTFVTLGIGAFYAMKKMTQFEFEHTHIVGEKEAISGFEGSAWGILGWSFLAAISAYLLMIPYCFVIVSSTKWFRKNTFISGNRLEFDYEGPWWGAIGWMLFSFVTLGLGSFYAEKKIIQWSIENTHFIESTQA